MPYKMDVALSVIDRIGKGIDPGFTIYLNSDVENFYKELIRYFHADPEFKGDLTKGILLIGNTGTGKTLAMQIMSIYRQIDDTKFIFNNKVFKMNFDVIRVNDIVNDFLNNAFDGIQVYCIRYVLCLDDIGIESNKVMYYGNALDVIAYILAERYAKRLLTFGTTNYNMNYLNDKYGDYIVSRIHTLFNFINTDGIRDFRKPK
jgi:DNA replication protein DnaC